MDGMETATYRLIKALTEINLFVYMEIMMLTERVQLHYFTFS